MALFLRIVRLFCVALWVGGLVFFIVVAGIAFRYLPDAHTAGIVVRNALLDIHRIGIYAAMLFILATLTLLALHRDNHPARAVELILAALMLALTLYSQLSIIPHMETDRLTAGGDIQKAPNSSPEVRDFDRLHARSVHAEGIVLIAGLALIALTPIHERKSR